MFRVLVCIVGLTMTGCTLASQELISVSDTPVPTQVAAAPSSTPTIRPTATTSSPQPTAQVGQPCTPRSDWTATYIVARGDTLFNIARRASSTVAEISAGNCLTDANQISAGQTLVLPRDIKNTIDLDLQYYLVGNSPVEGSIPVGCDGYLIPAFTGTKASTDTAANIRTSLNQLLSMTSTTVGQSGLINYLGGQGLTINSVRVSNGEATVVIDGTISLLGTCADPLIEGQILMSVFQPGVQRANITIGGTNMKQIFDMSGLVGADAVYTPNDVRHR